MIVVTILFLLSSLSFANGDTIIKALQDNPQQWFQAKFKTTDANTGEATYTIRYIYPSSQPTPTSLFPNIYKFQAHFEEGYLSRFTKTTVINLGTTDAHGEFLIELSPVNSQAVCEDVMGGFYKTSKDQCVCRKHGSRLSLNETILDPEKFKTNPELHCPIDSHRIWGPSDKICERKGAYFAPDYPDRCLCLEKGRRYGAVIEEIFLSNENKFSSCPSSHHRSLPAGADVLERVTDNCIRDRYWETSQCSFQDLLPENIDTYTIDDYSNGIGRFITPVASWEREFISFLFESPRLIVGSDLDDIQIISGGSLRRSIYNAIKEVTSQKNYSDCQKACLVKCFSSHIIDYGKNSKTKTKSTRQSYFHGEGVCTEFANIANQLAKKVDLRSRNVLGDGHAFNKVYIDGKWYFSEPQSPECTFYNLPTDSTHISNENRNGSQNNTPTEKPDTSTPRRTRSN